MTIWTDEAPSGPTRKPRGRERYAEIRPEGEADDGYGFTRAQLIRMNEKFAKAMARAGYGPLAYTDAETGPHASRNHR